MDCIFCKIGKGEIPSYKVYEDDYVLAFLDIHPCSKGHTVIIPKKHFGNLSEMSLEDWQFVTQGLALTLKRVNEVVKPDAANIGINNGKASGQAVDHVHWHIIPRWQGDGGGSMHAIIRAGEGVDVTAISELFK